MPTVTHHHPADLAFQVLLAATQFRPPEAGALPAPHPPGIEAVDWSLLLDLAYAHGLRPQLKEWLQRQSTIALPGPARERLQQETAGIAAHNLNNAREMLRLLRKLAAADIPCFPFKGAWMAEKVYGGLHRRESSDIDFFILKEDLPRIDALLRADGYVGQRDADPRDEATILRDYYEFSYDRYEGDLRLHHVDFHWRAAERSLRLEVGLPQLEAFLREDSFLQFPVCTFSPEGHFLLLILHHGAKDGWRRLRHVLDVARLVDTYGPDLDWASVLEQAGRWGVRKVLLTGLALAADLYGLPLPAALAAAARRPAVRRLAEDRRRMLARPPERWTPLTTFRHNLRYHWRSRDRLRDKLFLLKYDLGKILRPRHSELEESGLPPALAFLLPVHRVGRLLMDVIRGKLR